MRIQRVTAHAFGPLRDATLELAEGLTVVAGPNEAAKSTWHAAIYAAVCGVRRGPGSTARERRFAERHRPWDHGDWLVSAQLCLTDGRRIEMRQDLANRVASHAKDLDLGTDLSGEIIIDGGPDASAWLGLDRQSFAATAFVAQARMLDVLDQPDGLQELLQRAAATAAQDATAVAALGRIEEFRRERVGSERATRKPLRQAMAAVADARGELDRARMKLAEFERRQQMVRRLREVEAGAHEELHRHEAAVLYARAGTVTARAEEAGRLDDTLRDRPAEAAPDPAIAPLVATAIARWEAARAAAESYRATAETGAGTAGDGMAGGGTAVASDDELWELAQLLDEPVAQENDAGPGVDAVEAARAAVARAQRSRRRGGWLLAGGAFAGLLAGGAGAVGAGAVGGSGIAVAAFAAAAVVGAALVVGGLVLFGRSGLAAAQRELASAEGAETARREARAARLAALRQAQERRRSAEERCARLGLPADPGLLRELARRQAGAAGEAPVRERVTAHLNHAAAELLAAAAQAGVAAGTADEAHGGLIEFQRGLAAAAEQAAEDRRARDRLAYLLAGSTVAHLHDEARATLKRAEDSGFTAEEVGDLGEPGEERLDALRRVAQGATEQAAAATGALQTIREALPDIPAAEERLASAEEELARLRRLDGILARTAQFLTAAQERAHRDIAPVLAESVRRRLPVVTAGRYTDVIVNPADLRVEVCGPDRLWRRAELLSHGTAEQVYLLLRIALAEHLTRPGESCPLILDDVVVHADDERADQILSLLHAAAADRQIVLFSHQTRVRDWARTHLQAPEHALVELTPVPA